MSFRNTTVLLICFKNRVTDSVSQGSFTIDKTPNNKDLRLFTLGQELL